MDTAAATSFSTNRAARTGAAGECVILIPPMFMGKRAGVKCIANRSPIRHCSIHQRDEVLVMMPLNQMCQLMKENVPDALNRSLYQLNVQPHPAGLPTATPPLRFHFAHTEFIGLSANSLLAVWKHVGYKCPQLRPVPVVQQCLSTGLTCAWTDIHVDDRFVLNHDLGRTGALDDVQPVTAAEEIMRLAAYNLPF